jgi:ribosomal protein S18 acetylase RimI-like enzyme
MYPYNSPSIGAEAKSRQNVLLRDYHESDYSILADWEATYYNEVDHTEVFDERQFRADLELAKRDPTQKVLVAQVQDVVAGFIWLEEMVEDGAPIGYITNIHVDKRFRNRGLAQYLLGVGEEYFRSQNIRRLQLEVFETNSPARHIYVKNGYTQVGDYLEKTLS